MTSTDKYATEEFGWTQEEMGDSRTWLVDMRDMLQREVDSIESGQSTPEHYGESIGHDFVQGNLATIATINEVLK